jgi:hypothetical protein
MTAGTNKCNSNRKGNGRCDSRSSRFAKDDGRNKQVQQQQQRQRQVRQQILRFAKDDKSGHGEGWQEWTWRRMTRVDMAKDDKR